MSDPKPPWRLLGMTAFQVATLLILAGFIAVLLYVTATNPQPTDQPVSIVAPNEQAEDEPPPREDLGSMFGTERPEVCDEIIELLQRRCPSAGGLREEACQTIDAEAFLGLEPRHRGLGPGHYVDFGTGPEWFVDPEGYVMTANVAAFSLCPDMDSVIDRARQRAREKAARIREGDPTACSPLDIQHAEVIVMRLAELPPGFDDDDIDRTFAKIAKKNGVSRKFVRDTWEKVKRLCPEAL